MRPFRFNYVYRERSTAYGILGGYCKGPTSNLRPYGEISFNTTIAQNAESPSIATVGFQLLH